MTEQQLRARAERRDQRRTALAWPAVAIETIGAILCTMAIIAIDWNLTATYVLLIIGAPMLLIGVVLIWWSAQ